MKRENRSLAYGYVRLSKDEVRDSLYTSGDSDSQSSVHSSQPEESESITNQKNIIASYCVQHGIVLLKIYSDDGWSGGNFDRPGFINMVNELALGNANLVITKDLSRLGRDMAEASYYAEKFFPENGIRYIAIADNFDSERENVMAPFQFAMNEVYLRDSSRKIREVMKMKRERGDYCSCPPYGYVKDPENKNRLIPDERTADTVRQIFKYAAEGKTLRWIACKLTEEGTQTPLQDKMMYRASYCVGSRVKASTEWNTTTLGRMLRNRVYLGSTVLGKTRKINFKSSKKVDIDEEEWCITNGTHEPLVTELLFDKAAANIGKQAVLYSKKNMRSNIFSGIAYCLECGRSMTCHCSAGGTYAYLVCSSVHSASSVKCGTRIKYEQISGIVKDELNRLISLCESEVEELISSAVNGNVESEEIQNKLRQVEKAKARLAVIEKVVLKLYMDNAGGILSDERMHEMIQALDKEASSLRIVVSSTDEQIVTREDVERRYRKFFDRVRNHAFVEELDRDTLITFIEKITIGKKIYDDRHEYSYNHRSATYVQNIHISYKFTGEMNKVPEVTEKDRLPKKRQI